MTKFHLDYGRADVRRLSSMEKFLREWRQDAVNKHQYDSAIYIGDKLLALTNDPNDAFFLAQVHFSRGHYTRTQTFLESTDMIARSPPCRYLHALALIKQSKYEDALASLGEENPTPTTHHTRRRGTSRSADDKFEAAMCYLRGLVYAQQNSYDRAKECFKEAVRIDVKCFEAFDQLMRNNLLSPDEEWAFLEELDFGAMAAGVASTQQESTASFVKMLYTTRLSKYHNAPRFQSAITTLTNNYPLANNQDLQIAQAELYFTQCRYRECIELTESLLKKDKYNFAIYPIHLACLHELGEKNKLFLIAHDLSDNHPEQPCSWLAVGSYYLTIGNMHDARKFFSKSSIMDPHFGPAWIGFAHTFAAEGEHDQAISAYSTAARLFQGTHLPQLFLGMQNLQQGNYTLADEYLQSAYQLCKTDPLLMNELGVVFYHNEHVNEAIKLFNSALKMATDVGADPKSWVSTRANLGHAYRKVGKYKEAKAEFEEVLRCGPPDVNIRCAMGLIYMNEGRNYDAVVSLHEALAISPQHPLANELLEAALNAMSHVEFTPAVLSENGELMFQSDDEVDRTIQARYGNTAVGGGGRGNSRRNGGSMSNDAPATGGGRSGTRRRKQLRDVTGRFGQRGAPDEEDTSVIGESSTLMDLSDAD